MVVMDACCETDAAPHMHDHLDDPTLADCCLRDLREQAHTERLIQRLTDVDVSEARQRLKAGVISREPQHIPEHDSDIDSLATDSDDEGEPS